jgi:hypothetical protein
VFERNPNEAASASPRQRAPRFTESSRAGLLPEDGIAGF